MDYGLRDLSDKAARDFGGSDFLRPIRRQSPRYLTIGEWWNISARANQAFISYKRREEKVSCHREMNVWCAAMCSVIVTTGISITELLPAKPGLLLARGVELHGDVWLWIERLLRRRQRVGLRGPHFPLFASVGRAQVGLEIPIHRATRRLRAWSEALKTGPLKWTMLRNTDEGTNVLRFPLPQKKRETLLRMAGIDG